MQLINSCGLGENPLLATAESARKAVGPFAIIFFASREEVEEWALDLCFLSQAQTSTLKVRRRFVLY